MLTDDDLTALREHWPLSAGHVDINELLDHIAALSATIKRLETPVVDREVQECERYHRNAMLVDSEYGRGLCAAYESVLPVCRRQAREIERLGKVTQNGWDRWDKAEDEKEALRAALIKARDRFRQYEAIHAAKPEPDQVKVSINRDMALMCDAALSLNSVETRS